MLLLALLLVAQPADTVARDTIIADTARADSAGRDIVYYGGKRVIFLAKTEEVLLLDSAWVKYREMSVHSDSIRYDIKLHQLSAYSDVLFTSGSENMTGDLLRYSIDSRRGMMRTAYTSVENGFFRANEVWLVRERVLDARGGSYTTCDREHPHYAFYGPRVKLLMDDVAITEPVLFKLFNTPVLAAPFWMIPVASKRKSGLMTFKVGNSSTEGLYSKNIGYYWVINDYSDMTFYADIMTKKGLQGRAEAVYVVTPYAQGNINASYISEWGAVPPRRRYSVNATHQSDRFLLGSELNAKLDLTSDATYIPEYTEDQLEWLKPDVFSYAQISRNLKRFGSLTVLAQQKTEFTKHTRWTDLPSVKLSLTQRPLGGGWNLSPSASFLHRTQDYLDSTDTALDSASRQLNGTGGLGVTSPAYSLGRLGTATVSEALGFAETRSYRNDTLTEQPRSVSSNLRASLDQRFLGTVGLTEAVGLTQSDNLRDSLPVDVTYTGNVTGRAILYRVFNVTAFGMRGLLHTMTPSAGLTYEPKVDAGPLFGRPHLLDPDVARVNLGLSNTFQAKFDTTGTKRDLGSVSFSSSYDLIDPASSPLKRLSPLLGTVSIDPLQGPNLNLSVDASAGFSFDSLKLSNDYSVATTFKWNRIGSDSTRQERGFQLGFSHTYGHTASGTNHMLTATAAVAIPGWKLSLTDLGYNFAQRQLANYGVLLTKDLHCWEAFAKLQKLGKRWSYDFEVRIKKLPDLKIGKGTFGSILPKIGE